MIEAIEVAAEHVPRGVRLGEEVRKGWSRRGRGFVSVCSVARERLAGRAALWIGTGWWDARCA